MPKALVLKIFSFQLRERKKEVHFGYESLADAEQLRSSCCKNATPPIQDMNSGFHRPLLRDLPETQ